MEPKKILAAVLLFSVSVIMLFANPSAGTRTDAGRSTFKNDVTALAADTYRISVSSDAVISHYFGKDVVEKIMKEPGCVGVRMYYGKHANGKSGFIFVGVDKFGKDMTPIVLAAPGPICPPYCGGS